MIQKLIRFAALVGVVGLSACEDALVVDNPNSANKEKVMKTPLDAEALIGSYYKRFHTGVYNSTTNMEGRLNVWSFMNFSSLANNCQNNSYPFGSANITNTPGNTCNGEHYRMYSFMGEVNRVASGFLRSLDATGAEKLDLGSVARNNRARAFAEMLRGMSLSYTALMYDSAAVISAQMADLDPGTLTGHTVLMDSAYAAFDRAITIAQDPASTDPTSTDGFPLPVSWIPSTRSFTAAEFVRFIRSHRARIRANMARTPDERAAVDWNAVIADVNNGFTTDFDIITGQTGFSNISWRSQYNSFSTWHQMPPFYIGMADTSGSYSAWLAQPVGDRGGNNTSFFMVTPDLRFPQGTTRAAQQTDFVLSSCQTALTKCKRYFWNRPASDDQFSGQGWGFSNYNFVRFRSWNTAGDAGVIREGRTPAMVLSELTLLRAEGEFRLGNFATARDLVNRSRTVGMLCPNATQTGGVWTGQTPGAAGACTVAQGVAFGGGLPALTAADNTTPVPGGNACVPKVPAAPAFNSVTCGTLWEALKYEKRMETAYTHYLPWYLDGRGWGDNAKGTPLYLPVPYQDWLARNKPANLIYHAGEVVGGAPGSAAPVGSYGW